MPIVGSSIMPLVHFLAQTSMEIHPSITEQITGVFSPNKTLLVYNLTAADMNTLFSMVDRLWP